MFCGSGPLEKTVVLDLGVFRKDVFLASDAIYIFFPRIKLCPCAFWNRNCVGLMGRTQGRQSFGPSLTGPWNIETVATETLQKFVKQQLHCRNLKLTKITSPCLALFSALFHSLLFSAGPPAEQLQNSSTTTTQAIRSISVISLLQAKTKPYRNCKVLGSTWMHSVTTGIYTGKLATCGIERRRAMERHSHRHTGKGTQEKAHSFPSLYHFTPPCNSCCQHHLKQSQFG